MLRSPAIVYQSTRHTHVSSHSQLVTSEHITKPPVPVCTPSGNIARNSAHGWRNYHYLCYFNVYWRLQIRATDYTFTKSAINSSQCRETRWSTRHMILWCDELTVWRVDWFAGNHWSGLSPQPTVIAVKRSWTGGHWADEATPSRACSVRNGGIAVVGCHQCHSTTPSSLKLVPSCVDVAKTQVTISLTKNIKWPKKCEKRNSKSNKKSKNEKGN